MATNGMTINGLNPLSALTADDKIPVWDTGASVEPTKEITAQNMANSVKSLASLPNTTEMNAAIEQSTAIKTETVTVSASGPWVDITGTQVDVDRVFKVEMAGRWVLFRKRTNNHQITILRINTSGDTIVLDTSDATITVTLYYI